ncbi:MAG TPA: S41 family peptidase [Longimicrobium sp.]|jgi:carboxyl-terminal processing protease
MARDPRRSDDPRRAARLTFLRSAVAGLVIPVLAGGFMLQRQANDGERLFYEVLTRIATRGVDSIPEDSLYEKAARGLLRSIGDPYAELYTPRELAAFQREGLRNGYGGLGMLLERVRDTTVITRVYPGNPAAAAGVRVGDRVIAVEGHRVIGLPLDSVTSRVLGVPGTPVRVTFVRPGEQPVVREVRRAIVHIPVVAYATVLEGGVGYLPLDRFSEASAEEVTRAVAALRAGGAKSLILDLRGNGGGSLEQSIRISNLFLARGQEILQVRYRDRPAEVYRAEGGPLASGEPIVVLTDAGSASASEIVAGALQDHDRAVVIGTPSFGKGLVQELFPLPDGYALKLTTAKWFTPSGRSIQRERRVSETGRFLPDTLPPSDSALSRLPEFRSDAGRIVRGGGGITPDLVVRPDTLGGGERALVQALTGRASVINEVLTELSLQWARAGVQRGFTVTPAWREAFFQRLVARGAPVDRAVWNAGLPLIDRLIADRVTSLALGEEASFLLTVPRDNQLQAALRVLRGARTQQEALARVPGATGGGR